MQRNFYFETVASLAIIVCAMVADGVQAEDEQTPLMHLNTIDSADVDDQTYGYVPKSNYDTFDWALTKNVFSKRNKNTIVSTFSVKLMLSILAEAAGEGTSTHRELQSAFPELKSLADTRNRYGKTFGSMLEADSKYKLNLGARMYVAPFIPPLQRYQSIVKAFYFSDVVSIDFSKAEEAAETINKWCANATKNHLKNIVNRNEIAESIILLLNTIYFNCGWRRPFATSETTSMDFHLDASKVIQCPFMIATESFYYAESTDLNAKILHLPFSGHKYAMYIVLPTKVDGLDELMMKIDTSKLQQGLHALEETEMKVAIPKFKFINSINLNGALQDLGVKTLFTNQTSLPLLARGSTVQDRLQLSNVLQRIGIEINEEGSKALTKPTSRIDAATEFIADRPFLFLIEDEISGTLIFSGKVVHPE